MKLYGSPFSPYARKARVLIVEKEITCDFIIDDPWSADPGERTLLAQAKPAPEAPPPPAASPPVEGFGEIPDAVDRTFDIS